MSESDDAERRRIELGLSRRLYCAIEQLRKEFALSSREEVFLYLLNCAIRYADAIKRGNEIPMECLASDKEVNKEFFFRLETDPALVDVAVVYVLKNDGTDYARLFRLNEETNPDKDRIATWIKREMGWAD